VPPALSVHGLEKRFGSVHALRGVDLEVAEGELVGLLGPNGAGKSTLVKIAVGLVRPTAGSVDVAGAPAGSRDARAALGYLAELFRFPGWYTADEVLELHQRLAGSRGGEAERKRLLELVALSDAATRRVDGMSKGMQQRLGVAQALIGEPRVLLLDEPTSALDPVTREDVVAELIAEVHDFGIPTLAVSHDPHLAAVADRLVLMHDRCIIQMGTPEAGYGNPASGAAARLLGYRNVHRGYVEGTTGAARLTWPDGGVSFPIDGQAAIGAQVDWMIDPAAIHLTDARDALPDAIPASVEVRHIDGRITQLGLRCGQGRLWVTMPDGMQVPESLAVHWSPTAIRCWAR
jgi:molybdate/tungstate transport system ATP-binding protein